MARQSKSARHPSGAKHDTSSSPQGCGGRGDGRGDTRCTIGGLPVYPKASYTRQDHEILRGPSFDVPSNTNALCQRMANKVHRDVMPGDSHATAMDSFKDEFGLRTSATTTPGLLKVMFIAMAGRKIRVQRQILRLSTTPTQRKRR